MNKIKIFLSLFLKNPGAGVVTGLQKMRQKLPLDYRFLTGGWSFWPSTIVFHCTARCNLRCKMCVVGSYSFPKELALRQIKRIIDQIAFFKPHFYIGGGEPLLRKDLEKIIAYAKKKGLMTTLTTNGTLLTMDRIKSLVKAGLDGISVSIDGPQEINDQIRGKGNFQKAVQAIEKLVKIRRQQRLVLPKIKIATVISGFTQNSLEKMTDFAEGLGVDEIVFLHLDFKTKKTALAHLKCLEKNFGQTAVCLGLITSDRMSADAQKLVAINRKIIKNQMKKISAKKRSVVVLFAPPVAYEKIDQYYSGKYFANFSCTNPWFSATILPNGDLVPCFSFKIGNLKKEKFASLWNNQKYRQFRKFLRAYGHLPGCFRCCGTTDIN